MSLVTGRSIRRISPIDQELIFKKIIPENPKMLYRFAKSYLGEDSPHRLEVLEKADLILGEASLSKRNDVLLSGSIRLEKGDIDAGIEQLELAMVSDPGDQKTRARLVRLYLQQGMLDKAKEDAEYLHRINRRNPAFQKLLKEVDDAIKVSEFEEKASAN